MGMYTEMILGCSFKDTLPSVCIDALICVINNLEPKENGEKVRKFIEEYDLEYLMFGSSYYFGVCRSNQKFWYDHIGKQWVISVRSNIKNYDRQIQKFLKYITPYVDRGSGYESGVFAYVQYEEADFPTMYTLRGVYGIEDDKLVQEE